MTSPRLLVVSLALILAACSTKPKVEADLPSLPPTKAAPKPEAPRVIKSKPKPRTTAGFVDPDTTTLMREKDRKTVVLPKEIDLPSLPSESEASGIQATPTPPPGGSVKGSPQSLDELVIPSP